MNKIKSILALLLSASMLLLLCACGNNSDTEETTGADTTDAVTTEADTTEAEAKAILTVKVVDAEGNAVEGAMVQLCNESNCFTAFTNAEGNGEFSETVVPEINTNCYLSLPYLPEGYEYTGEAKIYLNNGDSEFTFTVSKVG